MKELMNRRNFLKAALLTSAGSVLAGCFKTASTPSAAPMVENTPDVAATVRAAVKETVNASAGGAQAVEAAVVPATATPNVIAKVEEKSAAVENEGFPKFSISGVPDKVDSKNVLQANGKDAFGNTFANTIGLGTEMMFAEPGSILYGPDEDPKIVKTNAPHGAYIGPITQELFENKTGAANVAEGAFIWATGATMTVEMGDVTVNLEGQKGHNWFLVVRGLFPDGKQDTDRNVTAHFSNFVAGHTQVMRYPEGAYLSEGNFDQVAELSHNGGSNCGDAGCSNLSVFMLDLNTGAYDVIHQTETQGQTNVSWEQVASNWFTK